jgi:hypothetical protein
LVCRPPPPPTPPPPPLLRNHPAHLRNLTGPVCTAMHTAVRLTTPLDS